MFDKIPPVHTAQELLDIAFRRGRDAAGRAKSKKKGVATRLGKMKNSEVVRLDCVKTVLVERLHKILLDFPETKKMTLFYQELMKTTLEFEKFKKSCGAVNWAIIQVKKFWTQYHRKVTKCRDVALIPQVRSQFLGRISSVIKQIKANLIYLEDCRKIIRRYPVIKEMKTVAIVGFPNVGKTTLLWKLTGSKPEIAPYAFTTKGINVGYMKDVQLLDTPGTLNRFEKMNFIERQAYLAMKLAADEIVYVFDPTETYPMEMQEDLYKNTLKLGKKTFVFISKQDISNKERVEKLKEKYKSLSLTSLRNEIRS